MCKQHIAFGYFICGEQKCGHNVYPVCLVHLLPPTEGAVVEDNIGFCACDIDCYLSELAQDTMLRWLPLLLCCSAGRFCIHMSDTLWVA
jgi:hypothetical protein